MRALIDTTTAARPAAGDEAIPQYSRGMVLAVWAAAAVPMALLAWVVAPAVAGDGASQERFFITLLTALTFGLLWQAVLVVILVMRERRDPSWTNIRDRLWLRPPRTASRRGGRLWWWVLVFALALAAVDMAPFGPAGPDGRSFGLFLESDAGQATFHHAWWLYALVAFMLVLNTVVGEELLFRGLLLPRMQGAFGRADWIVNGVLFGVYHLHEPWIIPNAIMTGFLCAGPSRRYRSALMGIAIHSVESVFFLVVLLPVVIG
jgi:membrane protease YdiL (CAAX protease family)